MKISGLWRYPVKTMAGESLQTARLEALGIAGDRVVHIQSADGRLLTSRSYPEFLRLKGTLDADGGALVNGLPWTSPQVGAWVESIGGEGARLVSDVSADRFDVLPLMVVTDGAIAAFGQDYRRLRPNIVIDGVNGLNERLWPGVFLKIGKAVIGVDSRRLRCIMTAYHPDTLFRDTRITHDIYRRFEGRLGLNCFVVVGGDIAVGDEVLLARKRT